jgi:uncharacterized protein YndB with AHSA1/START domain
LIYLDDMPDSYPDLHYSDCPCVEVEAFIAAEPEAVFAAVSDINLPTRFSSELKAAHWLQPSSEPVVGARFTGRSSHPSAGEWETTCVVIELDAPRVFAYTVQGLDGDVSSTWRFTVVPEGSGTRLKQRLQMGPGRSFINLAIESMPEKESRILNRRVREHRENMQANLVGVKEMLEA